MKLIFENKAPFLLLHVFVVLVLVAFAGSGIAVAASDEEVVKPPSVFSSPPAVGTSVTCPVSGHVFTVDKDSPRSEYKGKHLVFCCMGCKPLFDADPEKYLKDK